MCAGCPQLRSSAGRSRPSRPRRLRDDRNGRTSSAKRSAATHRGTAAVFSSCLAPQARSRDRTSRAGCAACTLGATSTAACRRPPDRAYCRHPAAQYGGDPTRCTGGARVHERADPDTCGQPAPAVSTCIPCPRRRPRPAGRPVGRSNGSPSRGREPCGRGPRPLPRRSQPVTARGLVPAGRRDRTHQPRRGPTPQLPVHLQAR